MTGFHWCQASSTAECTAKKTAPMAFATTTSQDQSKDVTGRNAGADGFSDNSLAILKVTNLGLELSLEGQMVSVRKWHELYKRALLETDKQELASRIAEAERAIILRGRDLFNLSDNAETDEEVQALDDALYALRVLRTCLQPHTNTAQGIFGSRTKYLKRNEHQFS